MTSPRDPSGALDGIERSAHELAVRGSGVGVSWEDVLAMLQSPPFEELPSLDPDSARRSSGELRLLVRALRQEPYTMGTGGARPLVRVGYLIEGERGFQEARVRPAFAEALAARRSLLELAQDFSDLWAVDFGLWAHLSSGAVDHHGLALLWLSSPGRRLVQDLSVLRHLPGERTFGASDFSPSRLQAASGPLPSATPAPSRNGPWYELHAAIPGTALGTWEPAGGSVRAVLQLLEGRQGEPFFLRGAALAWALNQAVKQPYYELEGLQRDLREDLVLAFVAGFPSPADESRFAQHRASARLETACLLHAARLMGDDRSEAATAHGWSLARWLQSCAFRSPFVGGDEESLAARLRALLPSAASDIPSRDDVLDPSHFSDEGKGLDIAELALVAGAALHYNPEESQTHTKLLPTPLPLVHALRRVADRTLNPGERHVEALLARFRSGSTENASAKGNEARPLESVRNALGWAAPHVAPPLVARWLLSHHRISWLAKVSSEVQRECLELFRQQPLRHAWLALAVFSEGQELEPEARTWVAEAWRSVLQTTRGGLGQRGELALMAIGVLEQLSAEESERVTELVRSAALDWRHRDFEALVEAAEKHGLAAPWRAGMDGLLEMCADESVDTENRLRAALLAMRRASLSSRPERGEYLQRLASVGSRAPFNQNVALRRELRRLGFSSAPDSKGAQ